MVERAFGSLRGVMDELLAGEAERPGRQTGDDIFESDLSPEVSECQRCRRCRGGVEKCREVSRQCRGGVN
jgi:hypothetical protein